MLTWFMKANVCKRLSHNGKDKCLNISTLTRLGEAFIIGKEGPLFNSLIGLVFGIKWFLAEKKGHLLISKRGWVYGIKWLLVAS